MRRWLADRLDAWSCTLSDWAERVRPPYKLSPGLSGTELERITRKTLAQYQDKLIADIVAHPNPDWPELTKKPHTIGETLRIRLPNDYDAPDLPL